MKHLRQFCLCLFGGIVLTGTATRATADEWNKKTYVTTSQSIEVPGAILPPGKYVFKLLDSQSDRHIVQVLNDRENHVFATDFAIPKQRMEPVGKTILTFYEVPGGGPEPVRAWFYPGDTIGQEFVYSPKRMAEIRAAMRGSETTVAENRTPEPAPVTQPAEQPAAETPAPPPPAPEATESQPTEEQQPAETPAAAAAPAPAPAETPAPEPAMPHTAGNTIGIGLLGLTCVGLASSLRIANRRMGSSS